MTFQLVSDGILYVKMDIAYGKHHGIASADWMDGKLAHGLCTKLAFVILQARSTLYLYLSPQCWDLICNCQINCV